MSVVDGWSLTVRQVTGRTYDLSFIDFEAGCAPVSMGTFDASSSWVHLALWIDPGSGRATALVSGVVVGSAPVAGAPSAGELLLGIDSVCGSDAASTYAGDVANLRVWSRVVPEDELRVYANGEDPAVTAGLVHWYRMNENAGQRLFDGIGGSVGFRGRDATPEGTDPAWRPGP